MTVGNYPGDVASEVDDLTVRALWVLESRAGKRPSRAQIRRHLMARACRNARRDPQVSKLVRLAQDSAQQVARERAVYAAARSDPKVLPFRRRARR